MLKGQRGSGKKPANGRMAFPLQRHCTQGGNPFAQWVSASACEVKKAGGPLSEEALKGNVSEASEEIQMQQPVLGARISPTEAGF